MRLKVAAQYDAGHLAHIAVVTVFAIIFSSSMSYVEAQQAGMTDQAVPPEGRI